MRMKRNASSTKCHHRHFPLNWLCSERGKVSNTFQTQPQHEIIFSFLVAFLRLHFFSNQYFQWVFYIVIASGMIDLRSSIAVVSNDDRIKGYTNIVNIVMSSFRVYHLVADTPQERDDWLVALKEFVFSKPKVSRPSVKEDNMQF